MGKEKKQNKVRPTVLFVALWSPSNALTCKLCVPCLGDLIIILSQETILNFTVTSKDDQNVKMRHMTLLFIMHFTD